MATSGSCSPMIGVAAGAKAGEGVGAVEGAGMGEGPKIMSIVQSGFK